MTRLEKEMYKLAWDSRKYTNIGGEWFLGPCDMEYLLHLWWFKLYDHRITLANVHHVWEQLILWHYWDEAYYQHIER